MSHTPSVHSEQGGGTTTDGIILLNGATLEQAQAVGAVLAVGDNLGSLRFFIDGIGGLNSVPYPDPTEALVLAAGTPGAGSVPAGTWDYAYTVIPAAVSGTETLLSPSTQIVLAVPGNVNFSGVTLPDWALDAYVYRSGDGGTNWHQVGGPGAAFPEDGLVLTGTDTDNTAAPTDTGLPNDGLNTTLEQQWSYLGAFYAARMAASKFNMYPTGDTGAPATGAHAAGEFVVDSAGALFFCTTNGTPGTWKKVTLTTP